VAATELVAAVPPAGGRCGAGRGVHGCTLAAAGVGVPAGVVLREQRCAGEGASGHVRVPNRNGVTCVAGRFLRMKLVTGSRANGRRWAVLKRQEGQHGRYAQAYKDVSTRLRTEGPTRWRHDGGFQGHPSDRIPSKIMFGNLMRAARDEDVTTSPAASSSSQHDGDGAVDNDGNDNDETTASGDGSTAVKPSSDSDSDDNDDGSDDGSRTESCESEELDGAPPPATTSSAAPANSVQAAP
jgi:hypothetical protein